jgi:hypothetical protein
MIGGVLTQMTSQKQLLLLSLVSVFTPAFSEATGLNRCPDYVASHGELHCEFFVQQN